MTRKAFKTAAQEEQPYVFDYNCEVADFYRDHPEQKKKIFFIDASSLPASLLRGDETDEDEIGDLLSTNGNIHGAINQIYKDGLGGSLRDNIENYDCVILKTPRNQYNINQLGSDAPAAIVDVFAFDHEAGHLICQDGSGSEPNLAECVADAYAVIRHFQRFGTGSSSIGKLADMRALEMVFGGEGSHFTSPVVERVIADSKTTNFSALTPQETAELARHYAISHKMDSMFIQYIVRDFNAAVGVGKSVNLKELGKFVLSTTVPEEFKWGAAMVHAILDGQLSYNGARFNPPAGEGWTQMRQALEARAARFDLPQPKLVVSYGSNQLKLK